MSGVPVENPYTMKDMDTQEDYRECLEIFLTREGGTG